MWSAYSTTKLFLILFLVEASLGRYWPDPTDVMLRPFNPHSLDLWRQGNMTYSDLMKETYARDPYPNGNVTIRWDIMNKTMHTYTANITIFNYLKNHDIEGPWELKWTWEHEEILFNTLGAKSTLRDSKHVTVVDLPSSQTEQIVPNCCKGGLIPSGFKETNLAKSSSSFQISVARVFSSSPPNFIYLNTPGSEYICHTIFKTTTTPGYLNTWTTHCELYDRWRMYFVRSNWPPNI